MDFENLTEEQKAKARECRTAEELLGLVRNEGIELTDDQLDAISGGKDWDDFSCDDNECPYFNCGTFC